jgi:hypothetical protein
MQKQEPHEHINVPGYAQQSGSHQASQGLGKPIAHVQSACAHSLSPSHVAPDNDWQRLPCWGGESRAGHIDLQRSIMAGWESKRAGAGSSYHGGKKR